MMIMFTFSLTLLLTPIGFTVFQDLQISGEKVKEGNSMKKLILRLVCVLGS